MTQDAAVYLANHMNGPNDEKAPFGCFWCGKRVDVHEPGCPAAEACHKLSTEAEDRN